MRVCYADPPYLNQARKHYANDPRCAEVDHAALVAQLEGYDAWALSLSSVSLFRVLSCIEAAGLHEESGDYRVCSWVKPFAAFKVGVGLAYAWEPVIVRNARKRTREQDTVRDWVSANITLQRGTHGAKPDTFCYWLFEALNMEPGDTFVDLYPGSGAVTRAWQRWHAGEVARVDGRYAELFA
jgi:hypothetical protein